MNTITKKTAYGRYAALVDMATGHPTSLLMSEVHIGRSRENDVVLEGDLTASRKQARITRSGDCYFLEDLASTNGTLLNGKAIHGRAVLQHDDVLNLGRRVYLFTMVDAVADDEPTVNLDGSGMVSLLQSAQRVVSHVLTRLGASASAVNSPLSYAESLATTVPQSSKNRFAQGKLLSSALKQYQKRKHIPMSSVMQAQSHQSIR